MQKPDSRFTIMPGSRLILCLCCLLLAGCRRNFIILSYNVQNLFDDVKNGSEYTEFDPAGKNWDSKRYHSKLTALAGAIRKSTPGGPDLIALQEVENLNALEDLRHSYLAGLGYRFKVMVPVEGSATNVAFLSRHPILSTRAHNLLPGDSHPLRNILEIKLTYKGKALFVFNNHWKSKSGGEAASEPLRLEAAARLRNRLLTILQEDPDADIVIAGDFNENSSEYLQTGRNYQTAFIPAAEQVPSSYWGKSLFLTSQQGECGWDGKKLILFDPWTLLPEAEQGSYFHKDTWQTPDHFLLSRGLFDTTGFRFSGFEVVRAPFLLHTRTSRPLAWRNNGSGFSDHLPILLELSYCP